MLTVEHSRFLQHSGRPYRFVAIHGETWGVWRGTQIGAPLDLWLDYAGLMACPVQRKLASGMFKSMPGVCQKPMVHCLENGLSCKHVIGNSVASCKSLEILIGFGQETLGPWGCEQDSFFNVLLYLCVLINSPFGLNHRPSYDFEGQFIKTRQSFACLITQGAQGVEVELFASSEASADQCGGRAWVPVVSCSEGRVASLRRRDAVVASSLGKSSVQFGAVGGHGTWGGA